MGICNSKPYDNFNDDEPINSIIMTSLDITGYQYDVMNKVFFRMKTLQDPIQINTTSSQVLPVQVIIDADQMHQSQRNFIDLVLLIDHNRSMTGRKLAECKKACASVVEFLGPRDRVTVIKYDHTPKPLTRFIRMTPENKSTLLSMISSIECSIGTNGGNGGGSNSSDDSSTANIIKPIELSLKMLYHRKEANLLSSIFLISDSHDDSAYYEVKKLLSKYTFENPLIINTFGYGLYHNPHLLHSISSLTSGNYYWIKDITKLDEAFADCLGEMITIAGTNVEVIVKPIDMDLIPKLRIIKGYGFNQEWTSKEDVWRINSGNLVTGKTRSFMIELELPPIDELLSQDILSITILSAELRLNHLIPTKPDEAFLKEANLTINLINPNIPDYDKSIDSDVLLNMYRVRGGELIKLARLTTERGNTIEAEVIINQLINEMKLSRANIMDIDDDYDNLLLDFESLLQYLRNYNIESKAYLIECQRNHLQQISNLYTNSKYGNRKQNMMVQAIKAQKSNNSVLRGL